MDMSQYAGSDSADLKAKDFVGKNLKVKISEVKIHNFEATAEHPANSKPRLLFEGKEKGLVLNATNTQVMIAAYGQDGDQWVGREIGLAVKDYSDKGYGHGWVVTPLDVPAQTFEDDVPF